MKSINKINKLVLAILLTLAFSLSTVIAQNDTMYIMKSGVVVGQYNVNTEIDSIIFYNPTTDSSTTVTDYDGNVYNTVTIGSQVWMKENLRTTHYADGTPIPHVTASSNWDVLTATSKAYCYYDNDSATNASSYGALYTWAAAMNGETSSTANPSGIQGVCPTGWHLPSDDEWKELEMALGMSQAEADGGFWRGTNEGSKLSGNASLWSSGDLINNAEFGSSGFAAFPGGKRGSNGVFTSIGNYGRWGSATEANTDYTYSRKLFSYHSDVSRSTPNKEVGISIRCVRD